MKLLVDMNISPRLCDLLTQAGWQSLHWSAVGEPTAPDTVILEYAKKHGRVVLSHDLDFSAILSATQALEIIVRCEPGFADPMHLRFEHLKAHETRTTTALDPRFQHHYLSVLAGL